MNRAQDIHQEDVSLFSQFQQLWGSGNYQSAIALLNDLRLETKVLNADIINTIQDWLIELQNNQDPTFKTDKIQVAYTPPVLQSGEIYFQLH